VPVADIVVPLESRRRLKALLAQKAQHVLPSFVLLGDGILHLDRPGGWIRTFGILEIVTSAAVIVMFVREVRAARRGAHRAQHDHAIDWLDVGLAAMLMVEAGSHHQDTGHWPRPTLLLAATMLLIGLAHGGVMGFARRRRSLRVDSNGLSRGLRFFRRFSATWDRIAGIRIGESRAVIALSGGEEHVIDLADLDNADRVRDALQAAHRRWEAFKGAGRPRVNEAS
jgi:hypothetical protein